LANVSVNGITPTISGILDANNMLTIRG
jgi:hypothetical protein